MGLNSNKLNINDLTVVIPAYNEEKTIETLLNRLHETMQSAEIRYSVIIIDDRSTDKTSEIVERLADKFPITLLRKKDSHQRGKVSSLFAGFSFSKTQHIVVLHANLEFPPEFIPQMEKQITAKIGVIVAERKKTSLLSKLLRKNIQAAPGLILFNKQLLEKVFKYQIIPSSFESYIFERARNSKLEIKRLIIKETKRKSNVLNTLLEPIKNRLSNTKNDRTVQNIQTQPSDSMLGAGYVIKGKRYISHTKLLQSISAVHTFAPWQKWTLISVALLSVFGLVLFTKLTLIILIGFLSALYFSDILFNGFVVLQSLRKRPELTITDQELQEINDSDLPIYTILCPLYKEASVLPQFLESIKAIDYPKKKLEVLLLLEEDDTETLAVAEAMKLPSYVKIIKVPDSLPKTKPKACNYGLALAKGEYVVVYDAEDKPEPDQLKKAYIGFQKADKQVVCLQAKLNYYNANHNLLTRLFTAEYSLWFDVMLSGLQSIETIIPLGGTSNHFRKSVLYKLQGWDAFNVTEDCDLGARLFKIGYLTAIINSTTYEEATSNVFNWIRQRSRWIKGYIQTFLVHNRNPIEFIQKHGIHAIIFQLVVGGRIAFMLVNPLMWILTVVYFIAKSTIGELIEQLFPMIIFYIALLSLVFGNFLQMYYYMIGLVQRGHFHLVKYVFLIPIYWFIVSVAAVKASIQLIQNPFYWEKTLHGHHLHQLSLRKRLWFIEQSAVSAPLYVVSLVLGLIANYIFSAVVARNGDLNQIAIIGLITSISFFVQIPFGAFARTITYMLGVQGKSIDKQHLTISSIKNSFRIINILVQSIVLVSLGYLWFTNTQQALLPFIVTAISSLLIGYILFYQGVFQGMLKFDQLALIVCFEAVTKVGITLGLVLLGIPELLYLAFPLALTSSVIVSSYIYKKFTSTHTQSNAHEYNFPKKFYVASFITKMSGFLFLSTDVFFATVFLTKTDLASYVLLSYLGKMIYFSGMLSAQFLTPYLSRLTTSLKQYNKAFLYVFSVTMIFTLGAYVVFGVLSFLTAPLLYGEKALAIVPFTVEYGGAVVLFVIASLFVQYREIRKEYSFSLFGILFVAFQFIGVYIFHSSIELFVRVQFIVAFWYFISILVTNVITDILVSNRKVTNTSSLNIKRPLRILILNWRDIKHSWAGGAEVYIHELAKRWVADGHQVTIFSGWDRKTSKEEIIDGIKIVRKGGFITVYLWAIWYFLTRFRTTTDVVIDSENGIPFFSPLYTRKPTMLVVYHVHQAVFRKQLQFPFSQVAMFLESVCMPIVYRPYDTVTISESSKKDIINQLSFYESKVHVVTPGIDKAKYTPKKIKTSYPLMVYIGRLRSYKNVSTAVLAFAEIKKIHPTARFIIAGLGEEYDRLKKLVKKFKLESNIDFLGKITDQEKVDLLSSAWVMIQPSSFEGWGITVIEANACKTPVIASRVSGLIDSVLENRTGLLVDSRDVISLAQAINLIFSNSRKRKMLENNAIVWGHSFRWEESAKKFTDLLYRVTPLSYKAVDKIKPQQSITVSNKRFIWT